MGIVLGLHGTKLSIFVSKAIYRYAILIKFLSLDPSVPMDSCAVLVGAL